MIYRKLTNDEIETLRLNGCSSGNWDCVEVKKGFDPSRCRNVRFTGKVRIGLFEKDFVDKAGVTYTAGIENALIHNCTIGDNVSIYNIKDYIANYVIDDEAVIRNCGKIYNEGKSAFGNGTNVAVMNESGGRSIKIWDRLSSHLAYIMVLYRHRPAVIKKIEELIDKYIERQISDAGYIGNNSILINCSHLRNIRIGNNAYLEDVLFLNEGSVNSNRNAPVFIGPGVIMEHFIINSGSKVTDSTIIERCFIGQGCELAKQFSAHDSLFFANCKGFHGEVSSVFAGPYTVTHHKSTLLIAGLFSFMNAGSGTNQSNHMYKLGPVHQGVVERGSKTASDSYLLWPSHIGPYSFVKGRHLKIIDTSIFPFSYIIENNGESYLVPGMNLVNTGTIRDEKKWADRDLREDPDKIDFINFSYLTPFSVSRMIKGEESLDHLRNNSGENREFYNYNDNLKISSSALHKGIELYRMAIEYFIGRILVERLRNKELKSSEQLKEYLSYNEKQGADDWVDLAGLITPKKEVEKLLSEIESGEINSLEGIYLVFKKMFNNYNEWVWEWVADYLERIKNKHISNFTGEEIADIVDRGKKSMVSLSEKLLEDARKEYSANTMTGFGIDGDYNERHADYRQVRGTFDGNSIVQWIISENDKKVAEADMIKESVLRFMVNQ